MKHPANFLFKGIILLFISQAATVAAEGGYNYDDNLSGDWGGARDTLLEKGIAIGLNYTAEPAALLSGGYENGETYLHNINAELVVDLEKLVNLKRTQFVMKYSSRSGDSLASDYIVPASAEEGRYLYGDYINQVQEVYGGQTTKLVNFEIVSQLTPDLKVSFGRVVMADHFNTSPLNCSFINNSLCGNPKAIFTPYSLNAYPDATAGIHGSYRVSDMVEILAGVFDGGWSEQDPNGWDWSLGENGEAYAGELQLYFDRAESGGTPNVVKIGINHHTGDFKNLKIGELDESHTTGWILVNWMLYREQQDGSQGMAGFAGVAGSNDDEVSTLPMTYHLGFVYQGLFNGRDNDKLGMMFSLAEHSQYNTYTHDFVDGLVRDDELIFEVTYNFDLKYGVNIMPTYQYIANPNGSEFDDASVLGLKFSLSL